MLKILMMLAVCQFSVSVDPSATMFTVSVDPAALQPKQEEPKATPAVHKKYLAMFTRSACGPCQRWKRNVMPRLQRDGIHVELYDMDNADNYRKYGAKVDRVPAFVVCDYEDGTWYSELQFGEITEDTAKWMLAGSPEKPKTAATAEVGPSPPIRYIQWPGWGTIDLENYNRDCDCSMCQTIRVKQRDYQRQLESFRKSQASVTPDQEGTPHELVETVLDSMELRDSDVVGDFGCGDGRFLIAAARRGIRGIGIEIDPVRASVARANVKAAQLDHMIQIETGDALDFDAGRITVATAYLYPPLLEKLAPRLKSVRVVASPYHEIPGLAMSKNGDFWIRKN